MSDETKLTLQCPVHFRRGSKGRGDKALAPGGKQTGGVNRRSEETKLPLRCPVPSRRGSRGRVERRAGQPKAPATPPPAGRVPKISRLLALAIKFDGMLQRGEVR